MVRPSGQIAITTWGPRMFEPATSIWWNAVKAHAPEFHSAFTPWDRITTPEAVRDLLLAGGVHETEVLAEAGVQPLRSVEDWWAVVLGSGFRWTVDQMGPEKAERVRADCLRDLRATDARQFETNVIYAVARKTAA
jgi:hypothetical protein